MLAVVALSDEGSGHRFFDNMPHCKLPFLLSFFAAKRDVCFLLAQPAASLATPCALAAKLFILIYWRTFHLEVAERTFGQEVKVSG